MQINEQTAARAREHLRKLDPTALVNHDTFHALDQLSIEVMQEYPDATPEEIAERTHQRYTDQQIERTRAKGLKHRLGGDQ